MLVLLVVGSSAAAVTAGPVAAYTTGSQTVTVIDVVDGDTIDVQYANGTTDTVRLLGVDTPETYGENAPEEFEGVPDTQAGADCLATEGDDAKAFMTNAIAGEQVTLKFDSESDNRGYYGRLLAYVYVDGTNYNYRLVDIGHARVYDSTFSKSSSFYNAESAAQDAERNVWSCRDAGNDASIEVSEIHEDAAGDDNDNLNDEYVVLENTGSEAVDLTGWTVCDEAGKTYSFGGFTLSPGETVTLHSGSGSDSSSDVYWGRSTAVWNNGGDTVFVEDDSGTRQTSKAY